MWSRDCLFRTHVLDEEIEAFDTIVFLVECFLNGFLVLNKLFFIFSTDFGDDALVFILNVLSGLHHIGKFLSELRTLLLCFLEELNQHLNFGFLCLVPLWPWFNISKAWLWALAVLLSHFLFELFDLILHFLEFGLLLNSFLLILLNDHQKLVCLLFRHSQLRLPLLKSPL